MTVALTLAAHYLISFRYHLHHACVPISINVLVVLYHPAEVRCKFGVRIYNKTHSIMTIFHYMYVDLLTLYSVSSGNGNGE